MKRILLYFLSTHTHLYDRWRKLLQIGAPNYLIQAVLPNRVTWIHLHDGFQRNCAKCFAKNFRSVKYIYEKFLECLL